MKTVSGMHPVRSRMITGSNLLQNISSGSLNPLKTVQSVWDITTGGVIDNWSWNNAFKNRYGMIEVDLMGNYSRKLKKSARWMKGLLEEREAKV